MYDLVTFSFGLYILKIQKVCSRTGAQLRFARVRAVCKCECSCDAPLVRLSSLPEFSAANEVEFLVLVHGRAVLPIGIVSPPAKVAPHHL